MQRFVPRLVIAAPTDWVMWQTLDLLSADQPIELIISNMPLRPGVDLGQYAELYAHLLRRQYTEYAEVDLVLSTALGGRGALVRHFECAGPNGERIAQVQMYCVDRGRGYVATGLTERVRFDQAATTISDIFAGLEILDGGYIGTPVPDHWLLKDSIELLSPGHQASLTVTGEPVSSGVTLEEYTQAYGDALSKQFPGYREVSVTRALLLGGMPALVRSFEWAPVEQATLEQVQAYMLENGRGHVAALVVQGGPLEQVQQRFLRLLGGPLEAREDSGRALASSPLTPREAAYLRLEKGDLSGVLFPFGRGQRRDPAARADGVGDGQAGAFEWGLLRGVWSKAGDEA